MRDDATERDGGVPTLSRAFVTLGEALALYPLLPDATSWVGATSVDFAVVGNEAAWERTAHFRLSVVTADAREEKRWVLQNPVLMDDLSLDLLVEQALADEEGPAAIALLLHDTMDLQRRVTLLSEELRVSAAFSDDPDGERAALHAGLDAVTRDRDRLGRQFAQLEARINSQRGVGPA